jgi:Flp pilus assembly protein TadG
MRSRLQRGRSERGAALLEMALTLPLLLLVCVGILEFGRAYQTWQVLTNAAREEARIAVLPGLRPMRSRARQQYMVAGQLPRCQAATVVIDQNVSISIGTGTATASQVTVNYPFDFVVLDPIVQLATGQGNGTPSTLNMAASATMRNE